MYYPVRKMSAAMSHFQSDGLPILWPKEGMGLRRSWRKTFGHVSPSGCFFFTGTPLKSSKYKQVNLG